MRFIWRFDYSCNAWSAGLLKFPPIQGASMWPFGRKNPRRVSGLRISLWLIWLVAGEEEGGEKKGGSLKETRPKTWTCVRCVCVPLLCASHAQDPCYGDGVIREINVFGWPLIHPARSHSFSRMWRVSSGWILAPPFFSPQWKQYEDNKQLSVISGHPDSPFSSPLSPRSWSVIRRFEVARVFLWMLRWRGLGWGLWAPAKPVNLSLALLLLLPKAPFFFFLVWPGRSSCLPQEGLHTAATWSGIRGWKS